MRKFFLATFFLIITSSQTVAWASASDDFYLETKNAHHYVCDPIATGEMAQAREVANHLLATAENFKSDWNYSNAIHYAYLILGRFDLLSGDREGAKTNLLNAGSVAGSPQLNTFGPNMTLAKELLIKGERQAVLDYFELIGKYWRPANKTKLMSWTEQVAGGRIPEFRANLIY